MAWFCTSAQWVFVHAELLPSAAAEHQGQHPRLRTRRQGQEPWALAKVPCSKPHGACQQLPLSHLLACCSHSLCIKFMGKCSLFKSYLNFTLAYYNVSVAHRHVFYKKSFHLIMYLSVEDKIMTSTVYLIFTSKDYLPRQHKTVCRLMSKNP